MPGPRLQPPPFPSTIYWHLRVFPPPPRHSSSPIVSPFLGWCSRFSISCPFWLGWSPKHISFFFFCCQSSGMLKHRVKSSSLFTLSLLALNLRSLARFALLITCLFLVLCILCHQLGEGTVGSIVILFLRWSILFTSSVPDQDLDLGCAESGSRQANFLQNLHKNFYFINNRQICLLKPLQERSGCSPKES